MNLLEDFKEIKSDHKELKKFALTMAVFFGLVGTLALLFHGRHKVLWFGVSAPFVFFYFFKTEWLKPVQRVWMAFALVMGWGMTRVILSLLFYLVLTPFSLIARVLRKKFMDIEFRKKADSYWNLRSGEKEKNRNYEQQF